MKKLINQQPNKSLRWFLGLLPFALLLLLYLAASNARLAENPDDKLLPSFSNIGDAITRMAFVPDRRNGDYLLLNDTVSSLKRLAVGVGVSALIALTIGVLSGAIPFV